jgi:hypothetical protein
MAMVIVKLPLEIQILIIDFVDKFQDRLKLLVCRYWNAAFAERVYSCIKLEHTNPEPMVSFFYAIHIAFHENHS